MIEFYNDGGVFFMGLLSVIVAIIIIISIINVIIIFRGKNKNFLQNRKRINNIKSIGFFALVIGLIGQLIGLFSAFKAIEIGSIEISTTIILNGIKVSMITTIYGFAIFSLSFVFWVVIGKLDKKYFKFH